MVVFEESVPLFMQHYIGPPDERVKDWFMLNSPWYLITIFISYIFVVKIGSKLMEKRKPFDLKGVLVVYNCFQVLYSGYILKEIVASAYLSNYNFTCAVLDKSRSKVAMRMARTFWLFYISKIVDLLDTAFFVLRKKDSQLTFLHCYHHLTMVFNWYIGTSYLPGGQAFISVGLNSFVHVIMYTYYMLSAMGPKVRKYLWWKKYLTQLQLVQFFLVNYHIFRGLDSDCDLPKWLAYSTMCYLCTLIILFSNFYVKAYISRRRHRKPRGIFTKNSSEAVPRSDVKAAGDYKYE